MDHDMYTLLKRPALSTSRCLSKIQKTPRLWLDAGNSKSGMESDDMIVAPWTNGCSPATPSPSHAVILEVATGLIVGSWVVVVWSSAAGRRPSSLAVVLSPQGCKPLLLGVRVDVCTDDERDNVEERYPRLLREELLRKREADGGRDPADLHDRPEAGLDRCSNLVEGARAGDDGHSNEVNAVLDRRDLSRGSVNVGHHAPGGY
jgi:hypothetical protein